MVSSPTPIPATPELTDAPAWPGPVGASRGRLSPRDIDPDALKVVRKLLVGGYEAYLVGGCVRDLYLKRLPKDFDVATSVISEVICKTFCNLWIIGCRFKFVYVFYGPKIIETSTFRTAPESRGDDDPLITVDNEWGTVEDDARRRDFTINALFYDIASNTVVDFVDGLHDLDRGVIRTIGDPVVRFQEDPVRMIRAIKFAARLDFTIDDETWEALLDTAGDINKCSRARLLEEIYKIFRGGAARRSFELLLESRLLHEIMPSYLALHRERLVEAGKDRPGREVDPILFELLDALDEHTAETQSVASNGVVLAILFAPLVDDDWSGAPRRTIDRALEELMNEFSVALGVARKDRELAREVLVARHRMIDLQRGSGRRRSTLAQRQHFHDALVFLGICVRAYRAGGSELQFWQRLAAQATRGPAEGERRARPRKRRRRPRNRGGRAAGDAGSS